MIARHFLSAVAVAGLIGLAVPALAAAPRHREDGRRTARYEQRGYRGSQRAYHQYHGGRAYDRGGRGDYDHGRSYARSYRSNGRYYAARPYYRGYYRSYPVYGYYPYDYYYGDDYYGGYYYDGYWVPPPPRRVYYGRRVFWPRPGFGLSIHLGR
jgi:hypothetical protein